VPGEREAFVARECGRGGALLRDVRRIGALDVHAGADAVRVACDLRDQGLQRRGGDAGVAEEVEGAAPDAIAAHGEAAVDPA
ncbi:hypothetical protein LTR53_019595, partial [Teratosphaeriaceae sp. CCFEE 6253]